MYTNHTILVFILTYVFKFAFKLTLTSSFILFIFIKIHIIYLIYIVFVGYRIYVLVCYILYTQCIVLVRDYLINFKLNKSIFPLISVKFPRFFGFLSAVLSSAARRH